MRIANIAGMLLYALAALIGRLPLRALHRLGDAFGWLARVLNMREARVARCNLDIVYPQLDLSARENLLRAFLLALSRQPSAEESAKAMDVLGNLPAPEALARLGVVLFNLNEFVYVN